MNSLYLFPPDDNTPKKTCTGPCGRTLPATAEYFHCQESGKYGLKGRCKACRNAQDREHNELPEVKKHRQEQVKEYSSRPEVKNQIRDHHKIYYNRPDVKDRTREYQKEYGKTYYNRPGVREHKAEYKKEHYKEYYNCPEVKQRMRIGNHNYRARKRSITGTHTPAQIKEQLKRQKHRCYYAACGHAKFKKAKGRYVYHIEHTFPVSRMIGSDVPANDIGYLVLACPACNISKNDKFPWEWPEGGRLL